MEETKALTLPDVGQFKQDIQAINKFQGVVKSNMISGHDYGVIPGTNKPTLLKPGAEKIAKLLGLCDRYEIIDRKEDWGAPFFRYLVKCQLCNVSSGVIVSEGLGECNSYESKYRWRWVFQSELPDDARGDEGAKERHKLPFREINTRRGKAKQYRIENDDIFSQVNTILKMAKKRALVDAALSAGRLSDVFTQDIEDMTGVPEVIKSEPSFEKPAEPASSAPPTGGSTEAQRKKIFAMVQNQGMDLDASRELMMSLYGVNSTKELTKQQASDFIERLDKESQD